MVLTIVAFAFLVFTWVGVEVLHGCPRLHGALQDGGEDAVKLLAAGGRSPLGAGGRSARRSRSSGRKGAEGSTRLARTVPRQRVRDPLHLQPGRGLRRRRARDGPRGRRPDRLPRRVPRRRARDCSPGTWSATTTRGWSATCSASPPAWRAWSWARARSSARSARPTARPSTQQDRRADLPHRLPGGPPGRQEGPREDRHGPGQALGRQRRRRRGPRGLRHLRRQDRAGHRRGQDGRPDAPAPQGAQARPDSRHQPQPRASRGRRRALGRRRPSRSTSSTRP